MAIHLKHLRVLFRIENHNLHTIGFQMPDNVAKDDDLSTTVGPTCAC